MQIKKPSFTFCDLDDVTFGSSAFRTCVARIPTPADPWLSVPTSRWVWLLSVIGIQLLVISYRFSSSFLASEYFLIEYLYSFLLFRNPFALQLDPKGAYFWIIRGDQEVVTEVIG